LPKSAFRNNTPKQGIASIYLHTTVKKPYKKSSLNASFNGINPIAITYDKLQATDLNAKSHADLAMHTPKGENDTNATAMYLYGKVTPGKNFYNGVTEDHKTTALYTDVYCDPVSPYYEYAIFDQSTFGENEDAINWHLADMFSSGQIGSFGLLATHYGAQNASPRVAAPGIAPSNATIGPVWFNNAGNAKQQDINVSVTGSARPSIVKIQYTPKPWLIYDLDKDFYRVKFIGAGSWNGIGKTGKVSQTKSSKNTKTRMNW
jgi:hypothetical protein